MIAKTRFTFFVALFSLVLSVAPVTAQYNTGPTAEMRMTFTGKVYFDFGAYSLAVNGSPRNIGTPYSRGSRIVYQNGQGSSWDGTNFYNRNAYRYDLVSRYRYEERMLRTFGSLRKPTFKRPVALAGSSYIPYLPSQLTRGPQPTRNINAAIHTPPTRLPKFGTYGSSGAATGKYAGIPNWDVLAWK